MASCCRQSSRFSAFFGVIGVTTHDAWSAAPVVQKPPTMLGFKSKAASANAVGSNQSLCSHRSTLATPYRLTVARACPSV